MGSLVIQLFLSFLFRMIKFVFVDLNKTERDNYCALRNISNKVWTPSNDDGVPLSELIASKTSDFINFLLRRASSSSSADGEKKCLRVTRARLHRPYTAKLGNGRESYVVKIIIMTSPFVQDIAADRPPYTYIYNIYVFIRCIQSRPSHST